MDSKATILHSEVHKDWSGEPIRILQEALGMQKRGYRVIIAAPPDSELIKRAAAAGVTTEPMIMKKWLSYPYSLLRALIAMIRHRVDIVNTHASYDSWIFSIAAKLLKRKLIRTRHIEMKYGNSVTRRFIYRLPDLLITCGGESGRQRLIHNFSLPAEKVTSIPSGPDHTIFDPDRVKAEETFGIAPEEKVVGIVASIRSMKGHRYLIDALPDIVGKGVSGIKFLIVGDGSSSILTELKDKINTQGLMKNCIFTGHRNDIPEMLSLMHIFVLPSISSEGTPQVLMQAMSMGLPVVSCPVGGIPELLGCPETPEFLQGSLHVTSHGILVPPKDPKALSEAVLYLLERPELCREIGKNNRNVIVEKYSSRLMFDRIEGIYSKLLDKSRSYNK